MRFTKMQGVGNDYIYVDCINQRIDDRPALARRLSDRHFGVGADGMICICPSDTADFRMEMYNADGSQGRMCGNGIRCVGKYVYERSLTDKAQLRIETLAGIKALRLEVENGKVHAVRVDMGRPILRPAEIPVLAEGERFVDRPVEVLGKTWRLTALSVGNPHAVTFVEDVDALDLPAIGPAFERHPLFPERVNTEFVQVLDRRRLKMRVWERGSGETMACGTGATAVLAAAALCGLAEDRATVMLLGGDLEIEWDRAADQLYMTGPAEFVFDGQLC